MRECEQVSCECNKEDPNYALLTCTQWVPVSYIRRIHSYLGEPILLFDASLYQRVKVTRSCAVKIIVVPTAFRPFHTSEDLGGSKDMLCRFSN